MIAEDNIGVRHLQATLLAGVLIVTHMQQGNLGIAVAALTKHQSDTTPAARNYVRYDWEKIHMRNVTAAFFYSQIVCNFLAAFITNKMNNKRILLFFSAIGTLTSYLTPTLVRLFEWKALLFVRLIQGAAQGFVKPVVYTQMARWFPTEELMLTGPMILSGIYIGVGFMLCMGGYLGTGRGAWPSIFYFSGNCGLIWCLAYAGLGSISPDTDFFISTTEKNYINQNIPVGILHPSRRKIPWCKILKCRPLYATMIAQSANNWAFRVFIKLTPMFYQEKLELELDSIGFVSGMSYIVLCINTFITNCIIKCWKRRSTVNHAVVRHLCNGIGQFGAYICFLLCSFSRSVVVTTVLHYLGIVITSFLLHGYYMNFYDLSPKYCGVIAGLSSGIAHICSILGPYISIRLYMNYVSNHAFNYLNLMLLEQTNKARLSFLEYNKFCR